MLRIFLKFSSYTKDNVRFSYSTIEPGSNDVFIHFYTKGSTDLHQSFYHFVHVHVQNFYNMHKDSVCYKRKTS